MGSLDDVLGFAAAICVLLTFCMRSMRLLRMVALLSNVLFIAYAFRTDLMPVLVLHGLLLPINLACLVRQWLASGTRSSTGVASKTETAQSTAASNASRPTDRQAMTTHDVGHFNLTPARCRSVSL